jgi:hypothetical protein
MTPAFDPAACARHEAPIDAASLPVPEVPAAGA